MLSLLKTGKKKDEEDRDHQKTKASSIPELEDLLARRDYAGAISLLQFRKREGDSDDSTDLWLGYCAFHAGQYCKAVEVYEKMLSRESCPPEVQTFLACSYYFLNQASKARDIAEKGPKNALQNRLLLHIYDKLDDDKKLKQCHSQLKETANDMLSLAAAHYRRSHFQEAVDAYKRVLSEYRDFTAIQVYLALCYYKLDYYDVSADTVKLYLTQYPDSPFALNLRACNHFKLYNGKAAERELQSIGENNLENALNVKDLITHNKVVFRDGDGALLIFPSLINSVHEARLNLIRFHLQREDVKTAMKLFDGYEPQTPQEYLLKATAFYKLGVERKSNEFLKAAEKLFLTVGESTTECDTVAGRQAMASANFISNQLDEVCIYLNSIQTFFKDDDVFNYNLGQALIATGNIKEGEAALLRVADQKIKRRLPYILSLARAYCLNGKGNLAWAFCRKWKHAEGLPTMLKIIANDCYEAEDYYHAALAFEALEGIEQSLTYWEGKKGAILGVLKLVVENKASMDHLKEVVSLLEKSQHPQAEEVLNSIAVFFEANKIEYP